MTEIIVLAVAAFAATNIDEAFVLAAFFSDPRMKLADVFVGQFVGMSVIVCLALLLALVSLAMPDRYVGYLGLLPILIGMKSLWLAGRDRKDPWDLDTPLDPRGALSSVALVTIANGGDNVAVYAPVFAHHTIPQILLICAIFGAMTCLWWLYGKLLASHPGAGQSIRRWGQPTIPFIFIAIGLYVMWRAGLFPWHGGGA